VVGRADSVARTQGSAPPCEVAKQTHSLAESGDHEKAKKITFRALSKRWREAGLKTSWDSDCGGETVLNWGGSWAALCVRGGERTHNTPPHPHLCIWVFFNSQNRNLEFQKVSHLNFPEQFLHCHPFAHASCWSVTAAARLQPCPAAGSASEATTAGLMLSNFHMLDLLSKKSFLPIQLCSG